MKRSLISPSMYLLAVVLAFIQLQTSYATPEEAQRLKPLAEFTKSAFGSILLGEPMKFDDSMYSMVRSVGSLLWRTGTMFRLPQTTMQKLQDYYDRIYDQVLRRDVSKVTRMTFKNLKAYIDEIIDSVMQEVEQSAKNSFDYTKVKVGQEQESLEEALINVGMQIRGYAVDVQNYRDLAKMVLGVPYVPTLASGIIDVSKIPAGLLNRAGVDMNNIMNLPGNSIQQASQLGQTAVNGLMNPTSTINSGINTLNSFIPGSLPLRVPNMPSLSSLSSNA